VREEHHPLAPFGTALEQEIEGLEPPQEVLGQLDPVDAGHHQPVVDGRLDLGQGRPASG
jgi:hypothetical protein